MDLQNPYVVALACAGVLVLIMLGVVIWTLNTNRKLVEQNATLTKLTADTNATLCSAVVTNQTSLSDLVGWLTTHAPPTFAPPRAGAVYGPGDSQHRPAPAQAPNMAMNDDPDNNRTPTNPSADTAVVPQSVTADEKRNPERRPPVAMVPGARPQQSTEPPIHHQSSGNPGDMVMGTPGERFTKVPPRGPQVTPGSPLSTDFDQVAELAERLRAHREGRPSHMALTTPQAAPHNRGAVEEENPALAGLPTAREQGVAIDHTLQKAETDILTTLVRYLRDRDPAAPAADEITVGMHLNAKRLRVLVRERHLQHVPVDSIIQRLHHVNKLDDAIIGVLLDGGLLDFNQVAIVRSLRTGMPEPDAVMELARNGHFGDETLKELRHNGKLDDSMFLRCLLQHPNLSDVRLASILEETNPQITVATLRSMYMEGVFADDRLPLFRLHNEDELNELTTRPGDPVFVKYATTADMLPAVI